MAWTPASGVEGFRTANIHADLVKAAASARGVLVEDVDKSAYSLSHEGKTVWFYGPMPDRTSFVARQIADSKHSTKKFLQRADVPAPEGRLFGWKNQKAAWAYAKVIGLPVVVKPVTGSSGKGVTSDINDEDHFQLAWSQIEQHSKVVVEKHVYGRDYRLFVVGDSYVAAIFRDPASVTGDGVHTISELVNVKNETRADNPYLNAKKVVLTPVMLRTLDQLGLSEKTILPSGRKITLHPVANVGAGGDSIDVTADVHPDFAKIAVRAAHSVPGVFFAGVDLLVPDISKAASEQEFAVCEINTRPDIALHHFPVLGEAHDVAGALVEALFPTAHRVPASNWEKRQLRLTGELVDPDIIMHLAAQNSVAGWVRVVDGTYLAIVAYGPGTALRKFEDKVSAIAKTQVASSPWHASVKRSGFVTATPVTSSKLERLAARRPQAVQSPRRKPARSGIASLLHRIKRKFMGIVGSLADVPKQ